jgi:hypothetical protein
MSDTPLHIDVYPVSFWVLVREDRNNLLSKCDWTQLSDNGLSDSKKAEWATYRQSLRDLPTTYSSATDRSGVTFPSEPS